MKARFYLLALCFLLAGSSVLLAQPNPPENLTATAGTSWNHPVFVKLDWQGPTMMGLTYNVYRKNGALNDTGSFFRRYTGIRHLNYNDYNVIPGRTYSYYVTAKNIQGESQPSNMVEIVLNGQGGTQGTISGLVTDDVSTLPIRNATAMFFRTSGYGMSYPARTDSNGAFSVNLPVGNYYLRTMAYGYVYEYFDNVPNLQDATVIQVTENTTQNINVGLAPVVPPVLYTLTGSVKDSLNNPLMAFIRIYGIRHFAHHHNIFATRTDSLGNYTLEVREGDTVVVYAMPVNRDYYPEFWDNKITFAEADRIPVTGNISDINFVLSHKPVYANGISGTVSDTLQNGVESFVIANRMAYGMHGRYVVSSDSLGSYAFENLVPGKYILLAHPKEGFMPTFFRYDGTPTLNWRQADSVMVDETSLITGINFTVHACPNFGEGTVAGLITSTGTPVDAAYVYAINTYGEIAGFGISDGSGNYIISGLPAGEYQVYSDKVDYTSQPATITVDYAGNLFQTVNLILTPDVVTGISNDKPEIVSSYQLFQNYPNPFNPVTTIKFSLPEKSNVRVTVYNILGIQVAQILNDVKDAGTHTVSFNASNLSSGVYFYKLEAGNFTSTRKLTLLK